MRLNSKKLIKTLLTSAILFASSNIPSIAVENQYSNQLLKVNIDKNSDENSVNVTLFSSKPYKIKLDTKKRPNNEYVIYLPETYHSITTKPVINSNDDSVKDVDIKLIPYVGSSTNNGYTKIIIKTTDNSLNFNVKNKVATDNIKIDDELETLTNLSEKKTTKIKPAETTTIKRENLNNKIEKNKTIETITQQKQRTANSTQIEKTQQHEKQIVEQKPAKKFIKEEKSTNEVKLISKANEEAIKNAPIVKNDELPAKTTLIETKQDNTKTETNLNQNENIYSNQSIIRIDKTNQSLTSEEKHTQTKNENKPNVLFVILLASLPICLLVIVNKIKNKKTKTICDIQKQEEENNLERKRKSEQILSRLSKTKPMKCTKDKCEIIDKPIETINSFSTNNDNELNERLNEKNYNEDKYTAYIPNESIIECNENLCNFHEIDDIKTEQQQEQNYSEYTCKNNHSIILTDENMINSHEQSFIENNKDKEDFANSTLYLNYLINEELKLNEEQLDILESVIKSQLRYKNNEDLFDDIACEVITKGKNLFKTIDDIKILQVYLNKITKSVTLEILKTKSRI